MFAHSFVNGHYYPFVYSKQGSLATPPSSLWKLTLIFLMAALIVCV